MGSSQPIWQALAAVGADRLTRLTMLAYVIVAVLYSVPFFGMDYRAELLNSDATDLIFLALISIAFGINWRRAKTPAAYRFWRALTLAMGCWVAAVVTLRPEIPVLVVDALYAGYYIGFVLAVEEQPHRRPLEHAFSGLLRWPFFAFFVVGLFVYFIVIPYSVNPAVYGSTLPLTYLLLTLDAYLVVKFAELYRRSESWKWRARYALLALATMIFFYHDLYNLPFYAAHTIRTWTVPSALLWNAQFVLLVLAARVRCPPRPAVTPKRQAAAPLDRFAEAREATLVVALLLPCIHFGAYTVGLLDEPSRTARDIVTLLWLGFAGVGALAQYRMLENRLARLDSTAAAKGSEILWREEMSRERERLITELEARNAELEAKSSEMESLNHSLSHDLKNPLLTIRGFTGLLREEAESGEPTRIRPVLGRIRNAAEQLAKQLEQVLQLSSIGRVSNPSEVVDMAELAREVAARAAARYPDAQPVISIDPLLPAIRGDRKQFGDALAHLLDNALKFRGSDVPRVEIGCRGESGAEVFFVGDNGIGIDERYRERVFDLFARLDPSAEGTGIGLTVTRRIVEVHGGRIWVESGESEGGTVVRFTLPGSPAETSVSGEWAIE